MLKFLGSIVKNIILRIMRFILVIVILPFLVCGAVVLIAFMIVVLPVTALFGPSEWFNHKNLIKDVSPELIID